MLHHFSVLFFIYKLKTNSKGYAPIFCRVTLDGVRKQFSTGSAIKEQQWSNSNQRYKGISDDAKLKIMMNETTPFRRKLTHCFGAKLTMVFRGKLTHQNA